MGNKIVFYPVGNGDTSQIILANGRRILLDYRHQNEGESNDSPLIDLKGTLKKELKDSGRDYFDVVAFTHGDDDHISQSTEFFELEHAKKYQGGERIKIKELWVPAAMILDSATSEEMSAEFVVWRTEARYRLKEGRGIQVFSKPDKLKGWLEENGLTVADRQHLITDAGQLAKGFSLEKDQVEFFCHSPFIKHVDENEEFRNEASLIFQVRFVVNSTITNYFAIGDTSYGILEDIVNITEAKNHGDRLDWDILNIPHHCSYKALAEEKGDKETKPTKAIEKFLHHGQKGAYMISSSDPISDNAEAYKQKMPPHIQAKKAYLRYLKEVGGRELFVTMETPSVKKPVPIKFEITGSGHRLLEETYSGVSFLTSTTPPRAG
ncbi:MAG: hypothetical protein F9K24_19750 [Leptonema illini]|uniref:Metallo-beta-lactamase domain-containing protein n=1 Tax=Leptonema illini TaxID=183 RepID=A0A833LXB0_9LEPT|nr:MAG: hypothetical protein F9K24_19750 [Leptonema illini]